MRAASVGRFSLNRVPLICPNRNRILLSSTLRRRRPHTSASSRLTSTTDSRWGGFLRWTRLRALGISKGYRFTRQMPAVRPPSQHLKRLGENICPSTAKPTYGLTSDRQASRQVRSTLRLFARRIDFLLFVFVHFFDSRILVALAGCLSSCGWRARVRNRCLPLRRLRGSRCCGGWRVCLGAHLLNVRKKHARD